MICDRTKFKKSRITCLLWFAGTLLSFLLYWLIMANFVIRDFWDPSYVQKYERLRVDANENPQRQLWLVLGSSRVEYGLMPGVLADHMGDKNIPVMFNFGSGGAGLFRQFIYLRRLLEAGFKPQWVGVEIFWMDLNNPVFPPPDVPELQTRARKEELGDYAAYTDNPSRFIRNWKASRWNPFYEYGMRMPQQTLTLRLVPLPWVWRLQKNPYDNWGWLSMPPVTPDLYRAKMAEEKKRYENAFDGIKIAPKTDLALRKILDMCKNAGIHVFLLRMPDNGDLRALKHTTSIDDNTIESYIAVIQGEYRVPEINASLWIANDGFADGFHLNRKGGAQFTRRLADTLLTLKP